MAPSLQREEQGRRHLVLQLIPDVRRPSDSIVEVDAVLFDVGNTLLRVPHDPHQRAIATASHLGEIPFQNYKASLQRAREEWRVADGAPDSQDLPETWVGHIRRALELIDFSGDSEVAARLIEDSFLLDGWEVYADAQAVLEELRLQGIRMGIVSNWPPSLEATLEAAGLRRYFEVIVCSGVIGYAKPHPQIFREALQELEVAPEQTVYVGDDIKLDVEASAALGMPSVLLDRDERVPAHHSRIGSLHELPGLVVRKAG